MESIKEKKVKLTHNEIAARYREKNREYYNAYMNNYLKNSEAYKLNRSAYNATSYQRRKEKLAALNATILII